jgi:intein/homing endonuclease
MLDGYEILEKIMPISNESLLLTSKNFHEIKDVSLHFEDQVAIEGKEKIANVSNFYIKGQAKTKKIKTKAAYSLEATPEHRIKILNEQGNIVWRYFKDIRPGEWACIHRSTNIFPKDYVDLTEYLPKSTHYSNGQKHKDHNYPMCLDVKQGSLLGLLVGDGSWTSRGRLELTLHEQDLPFYKQVIFDAGLDGPIVKKKARSNFGYKLTIGSVVLREFYNKLGFSLSSTPDGKRVPWAIRQSPKDVQAAFLSSLFAADGCLGKEGRDVSLSTAAKQLAQEVQLMLLNFGIISRIATRQINGKDYYLVILRGQRSLKIFAEDITFGLPRKQDPLVAYLSKTDKDGGDTERIPNQEVWLKRLRDTLPTTKGKQPGSHHGAGKLLGTDYANGSTKLRNLRLEFRDLVGNCIKEGSNEQLTSYRLDALIAFAEEFCTADQEAVDHFKYVRDCNYFYDPIVSVEDSDAFCVDLTVPEHEQYVAQGFTNHNSSCAAFIICYEWYKLCHIPNPQKYYRVASNTPITILILATTADQAKGTIFAQVQGMMKVVKYFAPLISKKLIEIKAEEITYKSKLLSIKSGNSKSSSQVGYSIILLVMDEMARVEGTTGDGEDEELNALSLWNNLGASGISFGPDAKRIALSSAWYEGDSIEELYKIAEVNPTYLGFRLRTWDLNPRFDRDNPVIASDYIANPRKAALEYEGIRAGLITGFFEADEVLSSFRGESSIDVTPKEGEPSYLTINKIDPYLGTSYGYLDPAVQRDSYTFAFGHKEIDKEGRAIVHIDGLLVWKPTPKHKVSIVHVQDLIKQVHNQRQLVQLGVDHHNSAETAERLTKEGIPVKVYPASNKMQVSQYSCTRELMHEGRLILPKDSRWRNLLQDEMTRVVMIKDTKINHPSNGSKDLADAVCGLCWLLLNRPSFNVFGPQVIRDTSSTSLPKFLESTSTTRTGFSSSYKKFFKKY